MRIIGRELLRGVVGTIVSAALILLAILALVSFGLAARAATALAARSYPSKPQRQPDRAWLALVLKLSRNRYAARYRPEDDRDEVLADEMIGHVKARLSVGRRWDSQSMCSGSLRQHGPAEQAYRPL
jgi:hypothetical protein